MKSTEFIKKLKDVADNYKTVYANGMFGQPITKSIVEQKAKQIPRWYGKNNNKENILALVGKGYFGFDCVCLIKGLLWGWDGDASKTNGGAVYCSNNVPDIGADEMLKVCKDISTNFKNIQPGEAVWTKGHIGVYIGDGKVIECTPKWNNDVQYSNLANLGYTSGNSRVWNKHGKLPYIEYETPKNKVTVTKKSIDEVAKEVLQGKWGNGSERKTKLEKAGYSYSEVQKKVNELCNKKSIEEVAKEVINGDWGNGSERKKKLTAAGYDYSAVQKKVNELCK